MELLDLLNSKIFNTAITLAIGGLLFSWISNKRARKDKLREKRIEFLEEVGNNFNSAVAQNFYRIRNQMPYSDKDQFTNVWAELFKKRFLIRLKSESYLKNKSFAYKYDFLIWEIRDITHFVGHTTYKPLTEEKIQEIQDRIERLQEEWPIKEMPHPKEKKVGPGYQKLLEWNSMVYKRALKLLIKNLKSSN